MSKKNLRLGLILVILVAFAYLYQGPFHDWKSNWGKPENFFAKINIDEISEIEIQSAGKTTILEKDGENWKIKGTKDFYIKKFAQSMLNTALQNAVDSEFELISNVGDKKRDFLTDDQGIKVKIYYGDDILSNFIVGKIAPDYESTYISLPDSDDTYSIKINLYSVFSVEEWRDDVIFDSDKENIIKIRFQYPDREFSIAKEEGTWNGIIPYRFGVSDEKIDKILEIMSNLQASEIPEQDFSVTGLEKNLIIIQATGEYIDNTLMVGNKVLNSKTGEDKYYVKKGNSDNIYLITKEQRDELDKKILELK